MKNLPINLRKAILIVLVLIIGSAIIFIETSIEVLVWYYTGKDSLYLLVWQLALMPILQAPIIMYMIDCIKRTVKAHDKINP